MQRAGGLGSQQRGLAHVELGNDVEGTRNLVKAHLRQLVQSLEHGLSRWRMYLNERMSTWHRSAPLNRNLLLEGRRKRQQALTRHGAPYASG